MNCLPTDPDWKTVSAVTGTCNSTFASPYPCIRAGRPSRTIASASPGIVCSFIAAAT